MPKIKSLKFGGTSMQNAQSILECADIVRIACLNHQIIVTVSAVAKATDELLHIIDLAKKHKPRLVNKAIALLEEKHYQILDQLQQDKNLTDEIWRQKFLPLFEKLRAISYGTSLVGDMTQKTQAQIGSFGEKLASKLMVLALATKGVKAKPIEAEKIIKTDNCYLEANVNLKTTTLACRKVLTPLIKEHLVPVVTGFIGKDTHGNTTLLGRGGSDYTASILAIALKAEAIEIWTDVNGIMSADPRLIADAVSWSEIDISVMSEMAYSGAKVIHPKSIALAVKKQIPVYIFNTFDRNFKGTKIVTQPTLGIKGIITNHENTIFHFDNPNMLDQVGFIAKIIDIVKSCGVPIDVCATSETSFTFSIKKYHSSEKLYKSLGDFTTAKIFTNISKISLIGGNITQDPNLLSTIFNLGHEYGIKLYAVSIGTSFRNITLMTDKKDAAQLLNLLHKKLILKK